MQASLAKSAIEQLHKLSTLPHDLSPWGMFMNADIVVRAVMVGLVGDMDGVARQGAGTVRLAGQRTARDGPA